MKKRVAAAAVALTLAGGGVGYALGGPPIAFGADEESSTESPSGTNAAPDGRPGAPGEWIAEALAGLVDDGTLTQAQSDAVVAALEAARPAHPGPGPGGRGHGLDAAASVLGIDAATLRSELEAGKTIADVAGDRDVDVQTVIDAIVAEMQSHLAEAVENGRLTQEQADERSAEASDRATALVNGELPHHPDGPPPGAPDDAPTSGSTSTT